MAYYDLPSNVTSFAGLGTYLNNLSDPSGLFGILLLASVFVISFVSFSTKSGTKPAPAFMAASFMTFVASVMTAVMGWTSPIWSLLFLFASVTSLVMTWIDKEGG